ncbi:hypothetical protein BGX23_004424 [Mortierella sp. AD031]|nr:hypothetical protein BGX23_004424 [Mortierella sp. AD031]
MTRARCGWEPRSIYSQFKVCWTQQWQQIQIDDQILDELEWQHLTKQCKKAAQQILRTLETEAAVEAAAVDEYDTDDDDDEKEEESENEDEKGTLAKDSTVVAQPDLARPVPNHTPIEEMGLRRNDDEKEEEIETAAEIDTAAEIETAARAEAAVVANEVDSDVSMSSPEESLGDYSGDDDRHFCNFWYGVP